MDNSSIRKALPLAAARTWSPVSLVDFRSECQKSFTANLHSRLGATCPVPRLTLKGFLFSRIISTASLGEISMSSQSQVKRANSIESR